MIRYAHYFASTRIVNGRHDCGFMDEAIVFSVLLVALVLFITGRIRYDLVALVALVVLTALRIIPASVAFHGFGHPAVVTVGAVLVLSKVLENSGVIDVMEGWYSRVGQRLTVQVMSLSGLVAVLSAFMNNVGALSLLMPLGRQGCEHRQASLFRRTSCRCPSLRCLEA